MQTLAQSLPPAEMGTAQHQLKIMGLRRFVAQQLINTAKVLNEDNTKERAANAVFAIRLSVAKAIMPKPPTVHKY